MTTQNLIISNKHRWINPITDTEMRQQIRVFYRGIVNDRKLSLWRRFAICSKNLSRLEEQRSQGQDEVKIHNQIEAIKQEMAKIELEMKGEEGLLFQVQKLFYEDF